MRSARTRTTNEGGELRGARSLAGLPDLGVNNKRGMEC
jgi:hypothetical protein